MDRVKVAVIGVGGIAQVVHLPILTKMPDVDVVAVCEKERAKSQLVAEKFGIKGIYYDPQAMLEHEDIAAVIVCTSTDAHKEATLAALKAGKEVLVEKPIARRYDEALEMAETANAGKRKLMVGMNHRFRPDVMILKSFIEGKELGKVFYTKAGWLRKRSSEGSWFTQKEKSGGGVFIDLGIMVLDLALWLMGYPDVRHVSATHFNHKTRQVEDTSLVTLAMSNGATVRIEVSWSMSLDDDVYYCGTYGTDGSASLNPLRINKELHGNVVNVTPKKAESPQNLFNRSYENELKHFIGAVKGLHPIISTGDEAVQRMRVVDGVYRSARLEKEITLA